MTKYFYFLFFIICATLININAQSSRESKLHSFLPDYFNTILNKSNVEQHLPGNTRDFFTKIKTESTPNFNFINSYYSPEMNNLRRPSRTLIDSTVSEYFTYDSYGNIESYIQKILRDGQWIDSSKITFTYNGNGYWQTLLQEFMKEGSWSDYQRISYLYNESNELSFYSIEKKEGDTWVLNNRTTVTDSTDNEGNLLVITLSEDWDGNVFTDAERYFRTFDENKNILRIVSEELEDNEWIPYNRESFTYDEAGNILSEIREYWLDNNWENSSRETYTYINNLIYQELSENWINSWENSYLTTYYYDGDKVTSILDQSWTNKWVNNYNTTFTYDSKNNLLVEFEEQWNRNSNTWEEYSKDTYTYNNNNKVLSRFFEWWSDYSGYHADKYIYSYDTDDNLIKGEHFDLTDGEWVYSEGYFYYPIYYQGKEIFSINCYKMEIEYTGQTSISEGTNELTSYKLYQNYPNPFNPTTKISYSVPSVSFVTIKIYDVLGKEVTTLVNEEKASGTYDCVFDASMLVSGVYLYQLRAGEFVQTKKFMLLK